jgi:hypothetical protein
MSTPTINAQSTLDTFYRELALCHRMLDAGSADTTSLHIAGERCDDARDLLCHHLGIAHPIVWVDVLMIATACERLGISPADAQRTYSGQSELLDAAPAVDAATTNPSLETIAAVVTAWGFAPVAADALV